MTKRRLYPKRLFSHGITAVIFLKGVLRSINPVFSRNPKPPALAGGVFTKHKYVLLLNYPKWCTWI